jgi:multidrug efflux system outer membrane protein
MRLLIFSIIFLLNGCANNTKLTHINYPNKTKLGINYVKNNNPNSAWWYAFNIKQLNSMVHKALINNHDLKKANFLVLQSQRNLQQSYAAWLPAFDLNGNGFTGGTFNDNKLPFAPNNKNINFRGYAAGFTPNYSINFLKNKAQIQGAQAQLNQELAQKKATKIALISQVTGSYLMLLAQQEQIKLQNELLRNWRMRYNLDLKRYHAGLDDQNNYLESKAGLNETLQKLLALQAAKSKTENTLAKLLGENPHVLKLHGNIWQLASINLMPKALSSNVLLLRPDILQAKANIENSMANKGISEAAFFPEFNLTSLIGKASVTLGEIIAASPAIWIVQGGISAALLNMSQYAKVAADSEAVKSQYEAYLQTVYNAMSEVDTSLSQYHYLRDETSAIEKIYLASKTQSELSSIQFQQGAIDKRIWLRSCINSLNNKVKFLNTVSNSLDAAVQVYQAIGTS